MKDKRARITEFGEKMKELRERAGMTLKELSKETSISAVHLSSLERGEHKPNSTTVYKIANALNYRYDDLYELSVKKNAD